MEIPPNVTKAAIDFKITSKNKKANHELYRNWLFIKLSLLDLNQGPSD